MDGGGGGGEWDEQHYHTELSSVVSISTESELRLFSVTG